MIQELAEVDRCLHRIGGVLRKVGKTIGQIPVVTLTRHTVDPKASADALRVAFGNDEQERKYPKDWWTPSRVYTVRDLLRNPVSVIRAWH